MRESHVLPGAARHHVRLTAHAMDKPPHQLEYRSAPHTYRQRVWWEVAWPLWLAIACLCGFVEWAVIVNAQGQINGWGQTALFAVLMVDFFDTLGTATAIGEQAGLVDSQGRVQSIRQILIVDSLAASIGGLFGVSSVTAYIESASGVAEGARTGLHSIFVGLMFFAAIFAAPLVGLVPSAATAPALILVGFLMMAQSSLKSNGQLTADN